MHAVGTCVLDVHKEESISKCDRRGRNSMCWEAGRSERQSKPGTKGGVADACVILQLLGMVSELGCYLNLSNGFHNLD